MNENSIYFANEFCASQHIYFYTNCHFSFIQFELIVINYKVFEYTSSYLSYFQTKSKTWKFHRVLNVLIWSTCHFEALENTS